MKAVIMAGGEGTRLRPLTCNLPKPMVPVVNKPMMEHILNLLKRHNLREIASTLCYMPEMIQEYFNDGSAYNVSMHYYIEEKPLGTAGSVKNAQQFLNEPFVVVSGDCLTDINLSAAIQFHREKGALATLVLTRVPNPLSYGVVIVNEDGQITQFLEKPSWSEVFSDTVNTGIYILEPEILDEIPSGEKYDFSQNLFPKLLAKKAPLYGYIAEGYWSDVGDLEVYRQAQRDCLDQKVTIELPPPTRPSLWIEADADIAPDVVIEGPVYVGKGVRIAAGCSLGAYSILGNYVHLDPGVSIKRSTLWSGVKVGSDAQLRGVVLANNVSLGPKTQAYEGSVIGAKVIIGAYTTIEPNVKVWPCKNVVSGSRLIQSVVWGHQNDRSLFSSTGVKGDLRTTLTPEIITKFGLACGAFLGLGSAVVVSSDGSKIGKVAKRALTGGLLAAGIKVYDVGSVTGNLTRFGVAYVQAQGALHCQAVPDNVNLVNIQCWDARGYWLSTQDRRKIENLLWREDFPRAAGDQLGEILFVPGLVRQYITSLAKLYAPHLKDLRVQVIADETDLASLVTQFLTKSGCIITGENPHLIIQIKGDQWIIKNASGKELTEDQWWELFVRGQRLRNRSQVAVPAYVSRRVADAAQQQQMEVKWTRNDPRAWMETASELGNTLVNDTENKTEHFPYIEPLVSIGEALRYWHSVDESMDRFAAASKPSRVHQHILCPWEDKGKVMRTMISTADPTQTEFLDGIRYYAQNGWVFVVPDGDEPLFHIYAEADTDEEADALAHYYAEKIENILSGGGE